MITIRRQPTVETEVPPLGECLAGFCSASASLGCSARVDFHEQPTRLFRFEYHVGWQVVRANCAQRQLWDEVNEADVAMDAINRLEEQIKEAE